MKLEADMGGQPETEGEDDSMPGFYEEEELDLDHLVHDDQTMEGSAEMPPKPRSKPRSGINAPPARPGTRSKDIFHPSEASGSGLPDPERVVAVAEHHTCPICGKQLKTDNQGLNAHVDFCLSKGAILEAQAEASSPRKPASKKRK